MQGDVLVRLDTKNPSVKAKLEEIIQATEGLHVLGSRDPAQADLVIVELGRDMDRALLSVQAEIEQGASHELFLTCENIDRAVVSKAMRAGAKEYLAQPLDESEVKLALERCIKRRTDYRERLPAKFGQVVHVIGSKGGVGTTTIAVNLAVSLAEATDLVSVALVDMNTVFGEIPLFMDIKPEHHWGKVANNIHRLDSPFLMNILVKHASGVYVLPSPSHLDSSKVATREVITQLLGFMTKVFDFVVIDGGNSLGDPSLSALQMADQVFLVCNQCLPGLANANKLMKSFQEIGYPEKARIKIILNSYMAGSCISVKNAEEGIGQPVFWTIPHDCESTMAAINEGKVLSEIARRSSVTKAVRALATTLVREAGGEPVQAKNRWSLPKLWQSKKAIRDENPPVKVGGQGMNELGTGGLT
jgi:pilus assembly protein CpaE